MSKRNYLPILTVLATITAFTPLYAWRGRDHYWINLAAAVQCEPVIPGMTNCSQQLAVLGHLPDVWKWSDPDEGFRHFIDLERYGYPHATLDPDQPGLYDRETDEYTNCEGIAPWTVCEALDNLTEAMATTNWIMAIRIAGALGHYAGDINMPLHTTANYDGQETGNDGVHGRWESEMPQRKTRPRYIPKTTPEYFEDPWVATTNAMAAAHHWVPAILDADTIAAETVANDLSDPEYYDVLWKKTKPIYCNQMDASAHFLASLWYTAWVNAGKPDVPLLTEEVSDQSIYYPPAQTNPFARIATWGFFILFALAGVLIIWKSLKK